MERPRHSTSKQQFPRQCEDTHHLPPMWGGNALNSPKTRTYVNSSTLPNILDFKINQSFTLLLSSLLGVSPCRRFGIVGLWGSCPHLHFLPPFSSSLSSCRSFTHRFPFFLFVFKLKPRVWGSGERVHVKGFSSIYFIKKKDSSFSLTFNESQMLEMVIKYLH